MALTTLKINIGGLAMFTQRTRGTPTQNGVFVLMPRMRELGAEHYPMLICDSKYVSGSTKPGQVVALLEERAEIDLRSYGDHGSPKTIDDHVAKVSQFAGNARVAKRWVDEAPEEALDARIALLLGIEVAPEMRKTAKFKVRVGESKRDIKVVGEALATMKVKSGAPNVLPLAGLTLVPDSAGELRFQLVNIPIVDALAPKHQKHYKGEVAHHFQGYYWLLEGHWDPPNGGPNLVVAADDDAERFIDPYKCTLGDGCLQGEPC